MPHQESQAPPDGATPDCAELLRRDAAARAQILQVIDLMVRMQGHLAHAHETADRALALCAEAQAEFDRAASHELRALRAGFDDGERAATEGPAPATGSARSDDPAA